MRASPAASHMPHFHLGCAPTICCIVVGKVAVVDVALARTLEDGSSLCPLQHAQTICSRLHALSDSWPIS